MKNILLLSLVSIVFFTSCSESFSQEDSYNNIIEITTPKTIAYLPLDDRPVNTTRAKYLCEQSNFTLLMPNIDSYQTRLDNQPLNNNSTQYGDIDNNIKWIKNINASYYVISLDQLLSGGLVNSRVMSEDDLTFTYQKIDQLFNIIKDKKVILFDTIMRLTSTVGYNNFSLDEYNQLREFNSLPRKVLNGNYSLNDIFSNYIINENNEVITQNIDQSLLNNHINARKRKMNISNYVLNKLDSFTNAFIYFGVDDSSNSNNIQTNEINYIKNKLNNGSLFAGTDELGLMSITKVISYHYLNQTSINLKAKISYYGDNKVSYADIYDFTTLQQTIINHLQSLDIEINNEQYDFNVLVLTKPNNANETNHIDLINQLKNNVINKVPTIVIDASSYSNYSKLQNDLINDDSLNLSFLLGYSNWNTVSNSIGIALSNGVSRYLYLTREKNKVNSADDGFIKTLTFSLLKDISYKIGGSTLVNEYITTNVGSISNFYSNNLDINKITQDCFNLLKDNYNLSINNVLNSLKNDKYISDLVLYKEKEMKQINVKNISFPWYRTFEIDFIFDISN